MPTALVICVEPLISTTECVEPKAMRGNRSNDQRFRWNSNFMPRSAPLNELCVLNWSWTRISAPPMFEVPPVDVGIQLVDSCW